MPLGGAEGETSGYCTGREDMILWSSEKLEQAFAAGELDSWTKVKYMMVPVMVGHLYTPFYVVRPVYGERAPAINYLFSFFFAMVALYLTYWGLKRCFIANREIDGKAFFERIAVLAVPIFFRIVAATILASLLLGFVVGVLVDWIPAVTHWVPILFSAFTPILAYATYVMLTNSIRRFGTLLKAGATNGCLTEPA